MVQQRARVLYKTQNGAKFLTQIKEILFQGEPFCLRVLLLSINPELPPAISKALETLLSQTTLISKSNFQAHCVDSPSQTFSEVTEICTGPFSPAYQLSWNAPDYPSSIQAVRK